MAQVPERSLPERLQYPPTHIQESLLGVFGLSRLASMQGGDRVLRDIVETTYRSNMPNLSVVDDDRKRNLIVARTKRVIAAPYRRGVSFDDIESAQLQTWLDGIAVGKFQGAIVRDYLGIGIKTFQSLKYRLYDFLDVSTAAGAIYSMRLHGYSHGVVVPADRTPPWSPRKKPKVLDFYLAGLSASAEEAAALTDRTPTAITSTWSRAAKDLGAKSVAQAVTYAFEADYFVPLPDEFLTF